VLVALSGTTFRIWQVWIQNLDVIASPVRVFQMVVPIMFASLLLLLASRKSNRSTIGIALTVSILGALGWWGGGLVAMLGPAGLIVLAALGWGTFSLIRRIDAHSPSALRGIAFASATFFLTQPLVVALMHVPSSTPNLSTHPSTIAGRHSPSVDFFFLVFDEYASLSTLAQYGGSDELAPALRASEFSVAQQAWAPSTLTVISLASLLDLGVPLSDGEKLNSSTKRALYELIRGEGRMFKAFQQAGYEITYVESGWSGSTCGGVVDHCYSRPFMDDFVEGVLDTSIFNPILKRQFAGSFAGGGLHALRTSVELGQILPHNRISDFVFVHVLLPHFPYRLDSRCALIPHSDLAGAPGTKPHDAYLEQVACVDTWLLQVVEVLPPEVAVVLAGDHGPTLAGQMYRDPHLWSDSDIRERASAFLATRLPVECGAARAESSLEAVSLATDCIVGTEFNQQVDDRIWLYSLEDGPRCVRPRGETFRTTTCDPT
jgi:hypothetical protein